jgi:very-short-patch-repair endonuclease
MERHRITSFARQLRRTMTDAEMRLWQHLRSRRLLGFKFRRQVPIGYYVVDFACLDAQLVIEVDGGQHAERESEDQRRTDWLSSQGFRVLRFWNDDVLLRTDIVLERVIKVLEGFDASGET